eukprot:TRINITY_DN12938_c0_g1_i1.p1 TRINITY_DN12938_c0_g1~~TRINITY_DN12938_c0_g1_i1.p1  ORF type:complete len:206 (+),score=12.10 TRINITY_DN12938_c0_g1_i1:259-876(+)
MSSLMHTSPWPATFRTPNSGNGPQAVPYMLQMVGMPVAGQTAQTIDTRNAPFAFLRHHTIPCGYSQLHQPVAQSMSPPIELKYPTDNVVLAVGQYREIRPIVTPALSTASGCQFIIEPDELPAGVQLDSGTGTIWGTPAPPSGEDDCDVQYRFFQVSVVGQSVKVSTTLGIKIVHFKPKSFKVTHVSQLDHNKYMVIIDTRKDNS